MDFLVESTTNQVQSTGGIALAGKIAEKIGLYFTDNKSKQEIKHPEVIRTMYGLYVQGKTSFEEIKLFRYDPFFRNSFGLSYVAAAETLRLYL